MAYNLEKNVLYVVAPDYKVYEINIETLALNSTPKVYTPSSLLSSHFFAGSVILRYDEASQCLYYAAQGQPGTTDMYPQFLGVYDTDVNSNSPFLVLYNSYEQSTTFPDIYDLLIEPNGYFYLSRKKKIDVFKNENNSIDKKKTHSTPNNFKNGRIVRISNGALYKIMILPMSNKNSEAHIYVLDGSNPTQGMQELTPNFLVENNIKKLFGGVYLSYANRIFFIAKPDNDDSNPSFNDFFVCDVSTDNNNNLILGEALQKNINIDGFPDDRNNFPTSIMLPESNDKVLVSKKNAVGYIDWLPDFSVFNYHSLSTGANFYNNYFDRILENKGGGGLDDIYVLNLGNSTFGTIDIQNPPFSSSVTLEPYYCGQYLSSGFYNPLNKRAYFYGNQKVSKSKIIAINTSDNSVSDEVIIDFPIGDCIFNPYKNEILVSDFSGSSFGRYNEALASIGSHISISGHTDLGSMYVSPNGLIYITSGMKAYDGMEQWVHIFSASTYENVAHINLGSNFIRSGEPPFNGVTDDLLAKFIYNPFDDNMYIAITHDPQIFSSSDLILDYAKSIVFRINHPHVLDPVVKETESLIFDMELIPSNATYPNGKLFISRNDSISMLDCNNFSGSWVSRRDIGAFIDLEYDPYTEKLFGLSEGAVGAGQDIYRISSENNAPPTSYGLNLSQYVSDIELITENRTLYAFSPFKESATPPTDLINMVVYSFNADDGLSLIEEKELDQRSLDRFMFYNKLDFDIVFDHPNNQIFIPLGGMSSISAINSLPDEKLVLNKGISWKSFPRLERTSPNHNVQIPKETLFPDQLFDDLDINIFNVTTNRYLSSYSQHEQLTGAIWENQEWTPIFISLESLNTTRGYTLDIESSSDQMLYTLKGSIYDTDVFEDTLYAGFQRGNWKGYYLTFNQHPVEAIPDEIEDDISMIKGQYWVCYNESPGGESTQWACVCNKGRTAIKYGDMVKIKARNQVNDFHWAIHGMTPNVADRPEVEYFSYEEQESYTPIFVEMDSSINPIEIGAFVNDSCVGATTVFEDDSTVLILAYTDDLSGDISFEQHYGLKSFLPPITKYAVRSNSRKREVRSIHTDEGEDYYVVSLKNGEKATKSNSEKDFWIKCMPNPAKERCTIKYYFSEDTDISIRVFSIYGNLVYEAVNTNSGADVQSFIFKCNSMSGQKLKPGTYILNISSDRNRAYEKIVIL